MEIIVEIEHYPMPGADPEYPEWYVHIPAMIGMGESGKTKKEAFEELMISLKVKIMYDNQITFD